MASSRFGSAALALAALLAPAEARAFDYVEHSYVTTEALRLAAASCPTAAACSGRATAAEGVKGRAGKDLLIAAVPALNSSNLCQGDQALADEPMGCLALGDLTALVDHSSSPLHLKWRWLNDCEAAQTEVSAGDQLLRAVGALWRSVRYPEEGLGSRPDVLGFLARVREKRASLWPLKDGDVLAEAVLGRLDAAYVALSEKNQPHFRPRLARPSKALASEREHVRLDGEKKERWLPRSHAFAYYADLHVGALGFAREAARARGEAKGFFEGVALMLEVYAIHFLQDGVSAGHITSDVTANAGSLQSTHDFYCATGVRAVPSKELCRVVSDARKVEAPEGSTLSRLDRLALACGLPEGDVPGMALPVRVVGDHLLDTEPEAAAATKDWAVAVSAESIREVLRVALGEGLDFDLPELGSCREAPYSAPYSKKDPTGYWWTKEHGACPTEPDGDRDQRLYSCLYRWWMGDEQGTPEDHAAVIRAAYAGSFLKALRMLPTPDDLAGAKPYPTIEYFSGHSLELGSMAGYQTADTSPYVGLDFGYAFASPRNVVPIDIGIDVRGIVSTAEGRTKLAGGALFGGKARLISANGAYVGAGAYVGPYWEGPGHLIAAGGPYGELGFRLEDRSRARTAFGLEGGLAKGRGAYVGLTLTRSLPLFGRAHVPTAEERSR